MSVSVPRDVSEWSSKPVPFSKKKSGTRAVFYEDNSVVQRRLPRNDWGGCVCYTEHPLPLGQVWQITVHKDRIIWAFEIGMSIQVTSVIPDEMLPYLPPSGPCDWKYTGSTIWHNNEPTTELPNLEELETETSVGILISGDGSLHLYIDGRYIKCVASDIPVATPLWGAVDVFGNCFKVKSELLCESEQPVVQCEAPVTEGRKPMLPEVLDLGILEAVGAEYGKFGVLLLNDKTGSLLNEIEHDCLGKSNRITLTILHKWLEGKGEHPTWSTLVKTLSSCKIYGLANKIKKQYMS